MNKILANYFIINFCNVKYEQKNYIIFRISNLMHLREIRSDDDDDSGDDDGDDDERKGEEITITM